MWAEWYSGGGYPASPQGVQRSSTAGRTWTDATPSNLKVVTKDNSISDFFALDADHAWITYGSVNYESPRPSSPRATGATTGRSSAASPITVARSSSSL